MKHTDIGKHPRYQLYEGFDRQSHRHYLVVTFKGVRVARGAHSRITPTGLRMTHALNAIEDVEDVIRADNRTFWVFSKGTLDSAELGLFVVTVLKSEIPGIQPM